MGLLYGKVDIHQAYGFATTDTTAFTKYIWRERSIEPTRSSFKFGHVTELLCEASHSRIESWKLLSATETGCLSKAPATTIPAAAAAAIKIAITTARAAAAAARSSNSR
jgi:hypothetical protein